MGFGKDGKGVMIRESRNQLLGTLANSTGIIVGTKLVMTTSFRMLKSKLTAFTEVLTAGQGAGLELWLATGDLSLAEVEEAIEVAGPLDRADRGRDEQVTRLVWKVAVSIPDGITATHLQMQGHKSASPIIEFEPRWTFGEDAGWNWVIYNRDGDALADLAEFRIHATHFGVWVGA